MYKMYDLKYSKKSAVQMFYEEVNVFNLLLDIKDTHNVFSWGNTEYKRNYVCSEENAAGHP